MTTNKRLSRGDPTVRQRRKRLATVTVLGFSSGLPLALTDSTLQAWLAVSDVEIATIGLYSLLGIPYVCKFLWAPLLDRYCPPWLGRRRGWMVASQFLVVILILLIAGRNPGNESLFVAWIALALAFASATQDIAVDAFRAETLLPYERGLGVGLSVAAYKVATIISGAGAFVIADKMGFSFAYASIAVLATIGISATFFAAEPSTDGAALPSSLSEALVQPFVAFFKRPDAVALLALVFLYKLGDAAAARLTVTFFVRALEFNLTEVGALYKGLGITASLVGGILGGAVMMRWGLYRPLVVFAVLQGLTNVGFMLLAMGGKSYVMMVIVVTLENLSGGMGTAALVALLIAICDQRYTATQFALLSGTASLGRVLSGPPAGFFVDAYGWAIFFAATILLVLPSVMLLRYLRGTIDKLDDFGTNGKPQATHR